MKKSKVVGVQLKNKGDIKFLVTSDLSMKFRDKCLIEFDYGYELGEVEFELPYKAKFKKKLGKIIKKLIGRDYKIWEKDKEREKNAYKICLEKIEKYNLPMKLICVKYHPKKRKFTFFYTAPQKVDFRKLVFDLVSSLKAKIEMKQIGVRDATKLVGGYGMCGLPLCCTTFLEKFESIPIKFAKDQNLAINPAKISGVCGRLMCCLAFEEKMYQELLRKAPKCGEKVKIFDKEGVIKEVDVISEKVKIEFEDQTEIKISFEELKTFKEGKVEK